MEGVSYACAQNQPIYASPVMMSSLGLGAILSN